MSDEKKARENIDRLLAAAGWHVCDVSRADIQASRGVAIREFPLKAGHGFADYLLYVDRKAAGVLEAKPEGFTLTGVETQSDKYTKGLPDNLPRWGNPLPFSYQSTGVETHFTNGLDPEPRARSVFASDQIRTIVRAFRDKLFTEIFPGREWVPKTPIFAKGEAETGEHPVRSPQPSGLAMDGRPWGFERSGTRERRNTPTPIHLLGFLFNGQ